MRGRIDEEGKLMALPTGIRRLVLAVAGMPLAAAMPAVMLASPASAAPLTVQTSHVAQAPAAHVYRTLATGLRVRKHPSTSARTIHVLGAKGSKVTVSCWTRGTPVLGDAVWYLVVKPAKGKGGYVAGFYLNTGRDPAAGVPFCTVAKRTFQTTVAHLKVRNHPTTTAKVNAVLGKAGTKVTVNCWIHGSNVFGDRVWYHSVAPHTGYVAGFYLNTGIDPAPGIRHC
jgi:hypothetical protein